MINNLQYTSLLQQYTRYDKSITLFFFFFVSCPCEYNRSFAMPAAAAATLRAGR